MGKVEVVKVSEAGMSGMAPSMQRKIGFVAIFKGVDYGERGFSIDDPVLYEDARDCRTENEDTKGFLAVAEVVWEEAA